MPGLVSAVVEPILGVLADVWRRRALIVGGGIVFGLTLLLIALGHHFWALMVAFVVQYPASGAFVSLSQAALMDHDPAAASTTWPAGRSPGQWAWSAARSFWERPRSWAAPGVKCSAAFGAVSFLLAGAALRHRFPNHRHPSDERSASRSGG